MALSLALVAGAVWTLLAIVGLLVQRRRPHPRWDLWDTLRGVRTLSALFPVAPWRRSSRLLGDGYRQGLRARTQGDARSARNLTRAELASTQSVIEQIDATLAEHTRQIGVLQAASAVKPLGAGRPHLLALRWLTRLEACVSPWLGPLGRLRVRLGVLRLAVWLLMRRIRALDQRVCTRTLESLPAIKADVTNLTRAATASRRTLLRSWQASRALVGDAERSAACQEK